LWETFSLWWRCRILLYCMLQQQHQLLAKTVHELCSWWKQQISGT
jgi:hypothetical protein